MLSIMLRHLQEILAQVPIPTKYADGQQKACTTESKIMQKEDVTGSIKQDTKHSSNASVYQ